MKRYIINRLIISCFILLGVSFILYALVRMMPNDFVSSIGANNANITPDAIDRLRRLYGLDNNIAEGYISWIGKALHGDFGASFLYRVPVRDVIASKMLVTFSFAFSALVLELLFAIPLGIILAVRPKSFTAKTLSLYSIIAISLPSFFLASLLQKVLALDLKIFPLSGMISARADYTGVRRIGDIVWHLILPLIALVTIRSGATIRYTRTNLLETLKEDYIRAARARGLSERRVIYGHAFRNATLFMVTVIGGMVPELFSGAIILEGVFSIEGLGLIAFKALQSGDIPFIMGFNMFLSAMTLCGALFADILYAVVDPRVRYRT